MSASQVDAPAAAALADHPPMPGYSVHVVPGHGPYGYVPTPSRAARVLTVALVVIARCFR